MYTYDMNASTVLASPDAAGTLCARKVNYYSTLPEYLKLFQFYIRTNRSSQNLYTGDPDVSKNFFC